MGPKIIAVVLGAFGALFPEVLIDWTKRAVLGPCFKNAADLEPRDWYVRAGRIQAVFMGIVGLLALLIESRQSQSETVAGSDHTPSPE